MTIIPPIGPSRQRQVRSLAETYINRAGRIYRRDFAIIPVSFDLKGRIAGMYRRLSGRPELRFNPYLFAKYFDDNLAVTVPHEVAHYVVDCLHPRRRPRPHGPEWQSVMAAFGADASRTCQYDLTGIPVRRQRRHPYACACRRHQLTSLRHNRIQRRLKRYFCRNCGGELIHSG